LLVRPELEERIFGTSGGIKVAEFEHAVYAARGFLAYHGIANTRGLGDASCFIVSLRVLVVIIRASYYLGLVLWGLWHLSV